MKTDSKILITFILSLIIIFGGFLRFSGLDWGLPWRYHVDENAFINAANAMRKAPNFNYLNPEWFYHPSLNIYIVSFISGIYSLFLPLTLPTVHLLGRISSAIWGTGSLLLVFLLGRRLYGVGAGILAALFLSVTVIHIQMSHFFTPDVMLSFFLMAVMWFSLGAMRSGRAGDYLGAGIFAGASMASKYWAPAILPLLTVHLIRMFSYRATGWKEQRKLLLGLAAAAAVFFLFSPYVILDAGRSVPAIRWWAKKTSGTIPQIWSYHFRGTAPYLFHLSRNLPWAMGWPLAILSAGGFIFCLARRKKEDIVLVVWIALNFLLIGSWYIKSIRYLIPIIPFFCICAGALIAGLPDRRWLRTLGTGLALIAFLWSGLFSLAFRQIYSTPHSKTQASLWVYEKIPPGSRIVTDLSVPLGERNALPASHRLSPLDLTYLFDSSHNAEQKKNHLSELVDEAGYIIIADEWRQYFRNPSPRHSAEQRFLEDLFAGRGDFELVESFKTYPQIGPWRINDDGAELSFHFFDHPGIYIFRRRDPQIQPTPKDNRVQSRLR